MWRLHLFELEDFAWFPNVLREGQTDYLRFMMHLFGVYNALIPKLAKVLEESPEKSIVDLCSGGGGGLLLADKYFQRNNIKLDSITLTDLYPNLSAFNYLNKISCGRINFEHRSIDALNIPENMKGVRTFFNSFHHFNPDKAQKILIDAVHAGVPICIFEPMEKSLLQLITNLFVTSIVCLLTTPFIRPFKSSRILFTYFIPLIPIVTTFDGLVSLARLYSPKHLDKLVKDLPENSYKWEVGTAPHTFGRATYLIGVPSINVQ